jgi:DNA-binding transcriptional LysR family regulator
LGVAAIDTSASLDAALEVQKLTEVEQALVVPKGHRLALTRPGAREDVVGLVRALVEHGNAWRTRSM